MEGWQIWVLICIILFILEIFTPGFILASFGVGALSSAGFAFMGFGIEFQLICFASASLMVFFAMRPVYKAYLNKYDDNLPTGVSAMLGKRATVIEPIQGADRVGRIKYGSETWRALCEGDQTFEVETMVKIVKVDGATVWVVPVEKE